MRAQRMHRRGLHRRRRPGGFLPHRSPAAIIGNGYCRIDAMRNFLKSGARALATFIEVAISVVGILMLLSFPAGASHHFDQHFRANEVRRSIVRHSLLDEPEADGAQTVEPSAAQPS